MKEVTGTPHSGQVRNVFAKLQLKLSRCVSNCRLEYSFNVGFGLLSSLGMLLYGLLQPGVWDREDRELGYLGHSRDVVCDSFLRI